MRGRLLGVGELGPGGRVHEQELRPDAERRLHDVLGDLVPAIVERAEAWPGRAVDEAREPGVLGHTVGIARHLGRDDLRDAEGRAIEREVAGLDAFEVDDGDDGAHHHRPLGEAVLLEFGFGQRHVGRAEGDGPGLDLLDAGAGTDRLIIETDAGLPLIGVSPFGVDRVGEGGAGTGEVGSDGWRLVYGPRLD